MENLCNKERYEHITELIKSIMKYDTYWYRSITFGTLLLWSAANGWSDLFFFECHWVPPELLAVISLQELLKMKEIQPPCHKLTHRD
jgi:hypothetical protein